MFFYRPFQFYFLICDCFTEHPTPPSPAVCLFSSIGSEWRSTYPAIPAPAHLIPLPFLLIDCEGPYFPFPPSYSVLVGSL